MESRKRERYLAACKRAYFRYCRGDDSGVTRVAQKFSVSPDRVVDDALDNSSEEDNFLPPSHLMEFSIRLLDRTGDIFKHKDFVGDGDLDWEAISAACEPVLTSRTAREWDIGAEKENVAAAGAEKSLRLVDLFPEAPTKVLEDKDSEDGNGVDAEEDTFDALNQKLSPTRFASMQYGRNNNSKTSRPHSLTRWITM